MAAMDERPRVLVSGSAVGYYGDRGDEMLREDSGRATTSSPKCASRGRRRPRRPSDAGIRVAHIRTGLVLGCGGALGKMLPLFRVGLGGRFGAGRQWWSWISMEDEIGAIRYLLDHEISGPVNLTGPEPVTNADFTARVGRACCIDRRVLPVPRFGPRLLLGRELGDAAPVLEPARRAQRC